MSSSETPYDIEHIAGDGEYAVEVVSGTRHQDRLEWLAQGRGEEPKEYACTAVLTHEPDNPFDANAVSVSILGVRVGFLSRDAAAGFVVAMDTWGFEQASCDAIIEGGWYRNAEDKGDFCVMLDANPDFVPSEFPPADDSLLEAAALPAPTAPAKSGYDIRSMGLGAIATMAMLAAVGAVLWMMPAQRVSHGPAVASRVQAPGPALLASAEPRLNAGGTAALRVNDEQKADTATAMPAEAKEQRNPEPAVVTSTRSVSVASTSAAAQSGARPAPSVAQRATTARSLAPQEPATVAPPIVKAVAGDVPTYEAAATDAAGTPVAESPAGVNSIGQSAIEALPAPAVPEVQTGADPKRPAMVAATSAADEIDPPVATASSPPAPPSPLPRPDPPETAEHDAPPAPTATQTAKPERKARSRYQRERFRGRSRNARSYTRSRSAARSGRSERRPPREEVASTSAAERPPNGIKLPNTPAARMLQGWTNELTSASSQLKRSDQ
jgi:hypothetical protein